MTSVTRVCRVEGCGRPFNCRDLCKTHGERERKGLSVDDYVVRVRNPAQGCSVPKCSRSHHAKRLCYKHYMRDYSGVVLDSFERDLTRYQGRKCFVSECDNSAGGERGLCKWHTNWSGKYGFSVVQALHILNSPTLCDICSSSLSNSNINVDHDHSCCPGQQTCGDCLRGLLCRGCNRALGSFSESKENVRKALAYLGG